MNEPVAWANYREDGVMVGIAEEACTAWRNPKPLYDHAIPSGYALVRVEPTEAMWGGLARDIMFVLRQERPTPKKLVTHLHALGHNIPDWLAVEIHDTNSDHVISKGTCCVPIYKAMLTAAAKGE